MPMVGGARAGVGGVRLADGSSDSGGGGGGDCGCFPIAPTGHTGIDALDTVDVSTLGTDEEWVFWVESFGAPFRLDRSALAATLTVDNTTILAVNGEANSRWVRLQWQNPTWQAQTAWWIDATSGDDENSGLAVNAPLKTPAEWVRRTFGADWSAVSLVSIWIISDIGLINLGGDFRLGGSTVLAVRGIETVLSPAGVTLDTVTPITGNTDYEISDAAIAVSWTASGYVTTTATRAKWIRNTAKTKHAQVVKDLGTKTARIFQPVNTSETPTAFPTTGAVDFVVGDLYEVYQYPKVGGLVCNYSGPGYIGAYLVEMDNGANLCNIQCQSDLQLVLGSQNAAGSCVSENSTIDKYANLQMRLWFHYNCATFSMRSGYMSATSYHYGGMYLADDDTNSYQSAGHVFFNGVFSVGRCFVYDNTTGNSALVRTFQGASCYCKQAITGNGSSVPTLQAETAGAIIYGGDNVAAGVTSSDRYEINGVSTNTLPAVDGVAGGAIYL